MSITEQIRSRIMEMNDGDVFLTSDFADISSIAKVKTEEGFSWGINPITQKPNKPLKITDYNSKKLELAFPDMLMTAEQAEVINSFIEDYDISVVIVKG